jgi:hypothetical protein
MIRLDPSFDGKPRDVARAASPAQA